ncbi:probable methyltransferase-like protein 24 [Crassostrea angulata]|uniref:probable methyltransferase-like protein 24 n=1 Tax=Magallana angulata TaxID=2784310 RepID=UPI0022B1BD99|nr:probable methyltransferase-like protein 24 [Crassostrea angulata]
MSGFWNVSMQSKKKIGLFSCVAFLIIVIYIFRLIPWRSYNHHGNVFEYDEYGDGDYDERARINHARKHVPKWNYTKENIGIFIRPRHDWMPTPKPTKFVPQIVVKKNEELSFSPSLPLPKIEENFYKFLEQKDVICKQDKRLGFQHDGGYNVCFSPPFGLKKPCLVYSFGIGNDWNFDDAVSKIYGCRDLAFDPSLKDLKNHNRSNLITFQKIGLGGRNGINSKGWKMKTLSQHLKDEGHTKSIIDYLKFDVEYTEWKILANILSDNSLDNVKQIGFEMHTPEFLAKFKNKNNPKHATVDDYLKMVKLLKGLEKKNFRKFNHRRNPFCEYHVTYAVKTYFSCYELHYVNMNFVTSNYTIVEN